MARIAGNQRTGARHPADDYPTDPRWTRVLTRNVPLRGTVWEPAAGSGLMAGTLEEAGYAVRATDIASGTDFLESSDRAGTIVTNPPYRLLDEFILHGLAQSDEMLCLLVGWHFLSGGSRRAQRIWTPHPPSRILVIPQRMPVNGTHSQFCHAWVVWDHSCPWSSPHIGWFTAEP